MRNFLCNLYFVIIFDLTFSHVNGFNLQLLEIDFKNWGYSRSFFGLNTDFKSFFCFKFLFINFYN